MPLLWKQPKRILLECDIFHENVSREFIRAVFETMRRANWHTYQILTKRPERMFKEMCDATDRIDGFDSGGHIPTSFPHVWLGVSVEDQKRADERIPWLLRTPGAVRFLSCEPLLGPVDIIKPMPSEDWIAIGRGHPAEIDLVVVGGESGHGARPMHPDWVRSIRDQCQEADVPFFFKGWGEWQNGSAKGKHNQIVLNTGRVFSEADTRGADEREWNLANPTMMAKVGKRAAGRLLDGRTWDEFPKASVPT